MELISPATVPVLLFCVLAGVAWWRTLLRILAATLALTVVLGVVELLRLITAALP